ncbi:MAG: transposase [Bacteroidales bacterium]|nr:transposase [Bacteroidales bacterium]
MRKKDMSHGCKINDQSKAYYLTLTIVEWIDIFTRKVYRDIVIDSLKYCQKEKGLELFAYVIMSNHIHMFCRSAFDDLSGLIRDFKKFTSSEIINTISDKEESRSDWLSNVFKFEATKHKRNSKYQIWQQNNYPEEVYSNKFIKQKVNINC